MTEPDWCFWCPFKGCQSCAYKSGGEPAAQGIPGARGTPRHSLYAGANGRIGHGKDERPTAPTVDRSEPLRFTLRTEGAYPSW